MSDATALQFNTVANDPQRALFNGSSAAQDWLAYLHCNGVTYCYRMRLSTMESEPDTDVSTIMSPLPPPNAAHALLRLHDHDSTADPEKSRTLEENYLRELDEHLDYFGSSAPAATAGPSSSADSA